MGRGIELVAQVGQLLRLDPEAFERAAAEISQELASNSAQKAIRQILTKHDSDAFAKQFIQELIEKYG